ncbi:MAG: hypothetical protein FGM57_00080 [Candidatus Taylorbacteria bacterium]|nr:hypothetical protein [Candidatus Taylorbacteria bacterium]
MKSGTKAVFSMALLMFGLFGMVRPAQVAACDFFYDCGFGGYYGGYNYQQFPYPIYTYNQPVNGGFSNQYNYQQFPYPVYTYNQNPGPRNPMDDYNNNFVQYPYPTYTYNQNPGPRNPMADYYYNYTPYPSLIYTYYNQSESSQLSQYNRNPQYTYNTNPYGQYSYGNSGFTMTSGY